MKRLLPTGICWCGCGQQLDLGSFFAPGHDKKAESRVIMEVFGGVPRFVDTFGYGPDGDQGAGTSWIDHVMRLRKVGASVIDKCAIEYPNAADRTGPLERTDFNVSMRLSKNLDGSLSLTEGAVGFSVPVNRATEIPFADITAVYQVSRPGPFWVIRVSGTLAFGDDLRYVPFGRDEPRGMTALGALRLKELAPLRDAAMSAWRRLDVEHLPPLRVDAPGAYPGDYVKHDFEAWLGFDNAVRMLSFDDAALKQRCAAFATALKDADECWLHARLQLEANGNKPDKNQIHWSATMYQWNGCTGQKVFEDARTTYVLLLRHIDGLVS